MRAKRKEIGISLRDAAKLTGMSHVNVKDIENDKIKPSFEKIINLLKAYHADIQEFLIETGCLPQNIEPELIEKLNPGLNSSLVTADKRDEDSDALKFSDADGWLISDVKGQNIIFEVKVKDDSMEPEFTEGDVIILDPHIKPDPNDFVIVKNNERKIVEVRQLKQYGQTWVLHPLNPKYPGIELSEKHQYEIAGKVVEKKKRY